MTEEARTTDVKETDDSSEKKEDTGKTFGFGMFGKSKKKKANAAVKAEEERKKQKETEENNEKKVGWVSFSDDENDDGNPEVGSLEGGDDDMEYELHRKIIRMTSSIQESGVDDTAFNEYMEEYKAKCVVLQPDRTKIIERESADFMITLKQSTEDTAKKIVVYGPGVEYIAQKLYLPENQSSHARLGNGSNL